MNEFVFVIPELILAAIVLVTIALFLSLFARLVRAVEKIASRSIH